MTNWRSDLCLGAVALWLPLCAAAAPFVPANEHTVLLQLDTATRTAAALARQQRGDAHTQAANTALSLANTYIELGRARGDERYFGYAAAALAPYTGAADASADLLAAWADVLQHQHRFAEAEQVLDGVLARAPRHARARLLRYTIRIAGGNPRAASADCRQLLGNADILIATTCIAQVTGLTGRLDASYALLAQTLPRFDTANPSQLAWAEGVLADMAERRGDLGAAESGLRRALARQPQTLATRLQLADILLQRNQPVAVLELLPENPADTAVLLRRALAARALNDTAQADALTKNWRASARQAGAMNIRLHLRDLARGELELAGNADAALRAAQENWRSQREPADARIFAAAARRAGDFKSLAELCIWQRDYGTEDIVLTRLLEGARPL